MEGSSQGKGNNEGIQKELQSGSIRRPKDFSFARRSEVYYFCEESMRGILRSVPIKSGCYRFNELETVVEKPDVAKIRNESWSDSPLDSPGTSKANENNLAAENDDSYESNQQVQKKEANLKSVDETFKKKSGPYVLTKLAILEAYKKSLEAKIEGKKLPKNAAAEQKNDIFYKPFKDLKKQLSNDSLETGFKMLKESASDQRYETVSASAKGNKSLKEDLFSKPFKDLKKQLSNDSLETDFKMLKESVSDQQYEEVSASAKGNSSLEIPSGRGDNRESLSKTWSDRSLSAAFMKLSMKPPITEL